LTGRYCTYKHIVSNHNDHSNCEQADCRVKRCRLVRADDLVGSSALQEMVLWDLSLPRQGTDLQILFLFSLSNVMFPDKKCMCSSKVITLMFVFVSQFAEYTEGGFRQKK